MRQRHTLRSHGQVIVARDSAAEFFTLAAEFAAESLSSSDSPPLPSGLSAALRASAPGLRGLFAAVAARPGRRGSGARTCRPGRLTLRVEPHVQQWRQRSTCSAARTACTARCLW